jgi:hypothetical protein
MSQTHDISGRKRRVIRKAKFEPQVALAVAEAIDNAMTDSKFVTVPILDARLAELREGLSKDIAACNERIGVTSERLMKELAVTNERLMKELAITNERLTKEIAVANERLLKEIGVTNDRTRADLVKWVLLAMLGSVAISAGAIAVNQTIEHYYH